MVNPFPDWSADIHDLPEQKRKFAKAVHGDVTLKSLDAKNQVARFWDFSKTKEYQTSLHRCTCTNFKRLYKPCKHMYRLALELGLLSPSDIPLSAADIPVAQRSLSDAISELENLPDICQKSVEFYPKNEEHLVFLTPELKPLTFSPLFARISPTVELLSKSTADKFVEHCRAYGFEPPDHTTKAKKAAWCVENASECFFAYTVAPEFLRVANKINTYLKRKYDWDKCFSWDGEVYYPAGSSQHTLDFSFLMSPEGAQSVPDDQDDKYYFPDDEVTHLLTLYGHNRCLNGFTATATPDFN